MLTFFVFLDKIGLNSENFKFERQPILSFIWQGMVHLSPCYEIFVAPWIQNDNAGTVSWTVDNDSILSTCQLVSPQFLKKKCSPPEFKMIMRALYLGRLTMSRSGPLVNWDPLNYQLLAAFVVNKYFYGSVWDRVASIVAHQDELLIQWRYI